MDVGGSYGVKKTDWNIVKMHSKHDTKWKKVDEVAVLKSS